VVDGREFLALTIDRPSALLGSDGDEVLPAFGLALFAGEGGAGKTTATIDFVAHAAAGKPWLDIPVARPLRILVVENEGPLAQFQRKIADKAETWEDQSFLENVFFLVEPWAGVSFKDETQRTALAEMCAEREIDLVVADPLDTLGIEGVGSPEETRDFMALLRSMGLHHSVAFWILHHVAKERGRPLLQKISGAWGGHPDVAFLYEREDRIRHRLSFGKVRWGDDSRAPLILERVPETRSLRVVEIADREAEGEANRQRVLDAVNRPQMTMKEIAKAVGLTVETVRKHLKALDGKIRLEEGQRGAFLASPLDGEIAAAAELWSDDE
jgi:hypothetical protein